MRPQIAQLLKMGKIPTYKDPEEYWNEYERIYNTIEEPVTIEEAKALLTCYHDAMEDDWEGGAQTLMHLIEGSGFRFIEKPDFRNEWHKYMWERQNR